MSVTEHKTHADIIAEVRFHAQQNIDAEKDKPEFGILTAEGRIALNYADELEAAHKREIEELKPKPDPDWNEICAKCNEGIEPSYCEYFGEPCGCNSPIYQHHPQTQRNNAAKLREALVLALSLLDLKEGVPYKTVSQKDIDFMKAALAEPARNCDWCPTWEAAKAAYWREQGDPADWRKLGAWLFAAKEEVRGEGSPRTEQESEVK